VKTAALKFAIFFVTVMIFAGCAGHPPRHPNVVIRGGSNTVAPGQTITLTAVVTNDKSGAGVVWAVVGSGTFTSTTTTLTYTAPANVPENPVVMITATTIATPTATETITFTLVGTGASDLMFLNGPYAFEASGFDNNGDALVMAGSFVSDGNGNILSAEIDENDHFALSNPTQLAGTYTLDSNLRGVITFNAGLNGFSDSATFAFTIDSATNTGSIVSADGEKPAISGLLAAQSAAASTTPSGNFIMRGTSDGATNASDGLAVRSGMVGRFTAGAGGVLSNGLVDSADIAQGNDSVDDTLSGTFSTTDGAGRGLVNFNTGQAGPVSGGYAYYIVSANKIFLVQIDNEVPGQFVAVARSQALSSLTASSVNGTGAFGLIGADDGATTSNTPIASAAIGQMIVTGGNTANVNCDVNDSGSISACSTNGNTPSPVPGVLAFDPTTGRGTITFSGGFDDGFVDSLVFYLEANGTGVMMDTTEPPGTGADSLPEALVGDLLPQTSTADITGQVQGLALIGDNQSIAAAGEFSVAANGDINGLFDGAFPGVPPLLDSATSGRVFTSDSTGRSDVTVTGDVFGGTNQPAAAFEADPTHFFVIGEIPATEALIFPSSLGIFTPQTLPAQAGARPATNAKQSAKVHGRKPVPAARIHKRPRAAHIKPPQAR
jgi:hypothetical protein